MGCRSSKIAFGVILGLLSGPACSKTPFAVKVEGLGVLDRLRPAMAVKGIGCITCHGTFKSNIITDFGGVESQHFLGQSSFGVQAPFYGNMVYPTGDGLSWNQTEAPFQTISMTGFLIMPRATLTPAEHPAILGSAYRPGAMPASISLKDFLSRYPYNAAEVPGPTPSGPPLLPGFTASQPMFRKEKIIEASKIVIRLPNDSEFEALQVPEPASLQPGNASGFERVTVPLVQGGLPNSFVQATGDIYCNGSLKFNDSIVLAGDPVENIIKVHTGARGCTLYVGRSAFISGKIQLAGTDRGGYLAIAAKHGIYAGYSIRRLIHRYFTPRNPRVGFWNYAFSERFNSSIRPPEPPLWPARRIDPSTWGWELLEDGIAIYMHELGAPAVLKDACSNPVVLETPWAPPNPAPDLPTDAAIVNPCGTRAVTDIEHVVLLAPSINWGFDGNFKGVMIAETAVGPAGRISFEFDDRFLERKGFQLFPDLERAMGGPLLDHEE